MSTRPRAARMKNIEPFHVMDLLAQARALEAQGRSMVHMEIGEPDFVTPEPVVDAGIAALQSGKTHYTPAVGLQALRERISRFYLDRYGVEVDAGRVIVTPGASGALQLVLSVIVNPGQQVLMSDPGYPCNRHFVRLVEGVPVTLPVDAGNDYHLTADQVADAWQAATVAVMLASPANPTGMLIPDKTLKSVIDVVAQRNGCVIVDEIYHGLVYDDAVQTALAFSDDVFVINSFSKYFGMTGWRIGWVIAPPEYVRDMDKLAQNIFLAASTPAQYAALACFEKETLAILEQRREVFKQRRDFLLPQLRRLGFDIPVTPQGAFYCYAGCQSFSKDSDRFARELMQEAGVVITPGLDFGSYQPQTHVRFAYTTAMEQLEEGVRRLEAFLA
jgi:aspartate/methionine/tyrosine aminotransferase